MDIQGISHPDCRVAINGHPDKAGGVVAQTSFFANMKAPQPFAIRNWIFSKVQAAGLAKNSSTFDTQIEFVVDQGATWEKHIHKFITNGVLAAVAQHIEVMNLSEQDRGAFWAMQFDMDQLYTTLLFLFTLWSNVDLFGIYSEEDAGAPWRKYIRSWSAAACEVIFEYRVLTIDRLNRTAIYYMDILASHDLMSGVVLGEGGHLVVPVHAVGGDQRMAFQLPTFK